MTTIEKIKDSWPQVVFIGGVLWVLFVSFFDQQVKAIAKREIESSMPTTVSFVELKAELTGLKSSVASFGSAAGTNSDNIGKIEGHIIRVEGKVDELILIMSQRQ